jgi:RNA polymerase sigma factor (sigma-70 family)
MQELAARYLPLVYTVVGRAAERDPDVDDIVQETMVDLVKGLAGLREPGRLRSWAVTVALRRLADARGAACEQRLARGGGLTELTELAERPDPASDFSGLVILRQVLTFEQREVAEASRWLDAGYRDLLSLWWLEVGGHLTRADVAAAVGRPASHVAVQVQRMREQLDTSRRVVAALRGRGQCLVLGEVLAAWDGEPDPLWRKRIARHLQGRVARVPGPARPPHPDAARR